MLNVLTATATITLTATASAIAATSPAAPTTASRGLICAWPREVQLPDYTAQ